MHTLGLPLFHFLRLRPLFAPEDGTGTPPADPPADTTAGDPPADPPADEPGDKSLLGDDGKGDDTTAGDKKDDNTPPTTFTFEDISVPEGFDIPEAAQEGLLAVVNDPALSKAEMVSKLLAMQGETMNAFATEQAQAWRTTEQSWKDAVPAALGVEAGEATKQALSEIRRGLDAAGATKEFYQALDVTAAGSHPAIVKMFHTLAKPYLESTPPGGDPANGKLSFEQKMYPTMQKNEG